jgi:hypothetical protein
MILSSYLHLPALSRKCYLYSNQNEFLIYTIRATSPSWFGQSKILGQ